MIYVNRLTGKRIIVRAGPTAMNDFWTDTGVGKFVTGLVSRGQQVSNIKLPTVETSVSISPETEKLIGSLQKTLLTGVGIIGGAILLSKLLK